MVAVTRLTLVLPPTVEIDRVACPPAFSILWKASSKIVSSSPIFTSESEVAKSFTGAQKLSSFHFRSLSTQSTKMPILV